MNFDFKLDSQRTLQFRINPDVFFPTGTSLALIDAFKEVVKAPGKTLDLGCGCGIVGIVAQKMGLVKGSLYASDLGQAPVDCARENALEHGCPVFAKSGSLFDPWVGEKFDCILDDVSGIAEEVAAVSPWFRNVSCRAGVDGTDLVLQVIEQAPNFLNERGVLLFPVISLSNEKKILLNAARHFSKVERILHKEWPMPADMKVHEDLLVRLHNEGHITMSKKFGMVVLYTDVYLATNEKEGGKKMSVITENDVLTVIREILGSEGKKLNRNSVASDFESWDSLGHLGILAALDKKFEGKAAHINDLAAADSVEKIIQILQKNALLS